ncbi:hypothetical protein Tco_1179260 [Tanacetum coccineum]
MYCTGYQTHLRKDHENTTVILWRTVIKDFYGIDGGFGSPYNSFGLGVSKGSGTSFWADPWCPNGSVLKDLYPRLFALETQKDCKVSDRWKCSSGTWSGNWSWRLPPRGRAIDDLLSLECLIGSLILDSYGDDKWVWMGDASGSLKVKTLSKSLQKLLLANDLIDKHCLWNS